MKLPSFRRKSLDVMPEGMWEQMVAAQDLGANIDYTQAVGLPAVLAVVRLISHTVGMVPLNVLLGDDEALKVRARDTWQWRLLHKRPGPPPTTPFSFKADLAAQFTGRGNAYIRKLKPTRATVRLTTGQAPRVTELLPVASAKVKPKRLNDGSIVFDDSSGDVNGKPVTRTTAEIIQVRSFSIGSDGLEGLSPITSARMMVSAGLKRQQFEERHLSNGVFPGLAVNFPKGMQEEQASRWLDFIESRHKGSAKAGKAIGVPNGADLTVLPISLEDALFADMTRLSMEQAAAMWQVPLALVTKQTRPVSDDDWRHYLAFAVSPVVTALAQSLTADDDLFRPDEDLTVVGDTAALTSIDALKKAQVEREQIQTGVRLADELRASDGLGPLPPVPKDWTQEPGKVPQITPVGGAPNPTADTTGTGPAPDDEGEGEK